MKKIGIKDLKPYTTFENEEKVEVYITNSQFYTPRIYYWITIEWEGRHLEKSYVDAPLTIVKFLNKKGFKKVVS